MSAARLSQRATIDQVAERAGVSIKTVSRVSNGEPNVRPELRARVEAAIRSLGYHPSPAARSLAGRRSDLLALVYDNPSPGYLLNLQMGARAVCHEHRYRLLFHPCDARNPALAEELTKLADDPGVEGLILTPPLSAQGALIESLAAARLPVALIAPPAAAEGAVLIDDEAAARLGTEHLLSLGHRRIAFVTGHPDHAATAQRRRGYELAMTSAGLVIDPQLVEAGGFSFGSGREAGARLLSRRRRATAIFASNDDMAAGIMAEAHSRGLVMPRDLSVVGFDDLPLAAMLWPALTTLRQPIAAMAERATRLLLARLRGKPAPSGPPLEFTLLTRASTAPPP